jgi:hypothetical protein
MNSKGSFMDHDLSIKPLRFIFIVIVPVVLVLFWIASPILSIITIFIYLLLVNPPKFINNLFIFITCLSLGLINYTKFPESDLASYLVTFERLSYYPVYEFYLVRPLDPLFYFVSSILYRLVDGHLPAFSLFWTSAIYYIAAISLLNFGRIIKLNRSWTLAAVFLLIVINYNFPLSAHLVRQYMAMSFLIYAFTCSLEGRYSSYLFFLLASLSHFSVIIFLPVIYFSMKKKVGGVELSLYLAILFLCSAVLGGTNLFLIIERIPTLGLDGLARIADRANNYALDDSAIRFRTYFDFLVYSCLCLYTLFMRKNRDGDVGKKIIFFIFYFWFLIFLFRNTDLLQLRYVFYGFGILSLSFIYTLKHREAMISIFFILMVVVAFPRFLRGLEYSGWTYIENSWRIVFYSLFDFLMYNPA